MCPRKREEFMTDYALYTLNSKKRDTNSIQSSVSGSRDGTHIYADRYDQNSIQSSVSWGRDGQHMYPHSNVGKPPSHFSIPARRIEPEPGSKFFRLTEEELSAGLEYLYEIATKEVIKFNEKKEIEKIGILSGKILFYNSRISDLSELKAVGHLEKTINIEKFFGFNFRVPLIDQFSPLSLSISIHMHYVRLPHRGAETLFRASLQFVKLMGGPQTFKEVRRDCIYCAKVRKQSMSQKMGPLNDCLHYSILQ